MSTSAIFSTGPIYRSVTTNPPTLLPQLRRSLPFHCTSIPSPEPFSPIFIDPSAQLPDFPSSHRWSALTGTVERDRKEHNHGGGGRYNWRPNMRHPKRIFLVHLYLDNSLLQRLLQC